MTVIAWDGLSVAADKQATSQDNTTFTVTKLFETDDGKVLAINGDLSHGIALMAWYKEGADPTKFPPCPPPECGSDRNCFLVVLAAKTKPLVYENYPVPYVVEDRWMAWGSGRSIALGAMAAGATAADAVGIANAFHEGCGKGIDVVEFRDVADVGGAGAATAGAVAPEAG